MRSLSNVDLLYMQHDRAVPDEALRVARALDDQGVPSGIAWSDPAPPPPRFKTAAELVGKMARLMVERSAASGACTDRDLAAAGFTAEEVERYREDATALAARIMGDRTSEVIQPRKSRQRA